MDTKKLQQRQRELEKQFEQLERDLKPYGTDPAVMQLSHPLRMKAAPPTASAEVLLGGITGVENAEFTRQQMLKGVCTNTIWYQLSERGSANLNRFLDHNSSGLDGGYSGGSSGATFQALRYMVCGGTMFTVDDDLCHLLDLTDIELDVLISDVVLPFDNIYIEAGRDRARTPIDLALRNDLTGLHAFEGAYCSRVVDHDGNTRIEVTMTGSPVGHSHISDDAVEWVSLTVEPGVTVAQALHNAFNRVIGVVGPDPVGALAQHSRVAALHEKRLAPLMSKRLEFILKALLYINEEDVRTEVVKDRSAAQQVLNRTHSGVLRKKALRQTLYARDTIIVKPPVMPEADARALAGMGGAGDSGRTVKPHWRRGHLRTQRYGAGYSMKKSVLIKPKLVNAALLAELGANVPPPPTKQYIVRRS